MRSVFFLFFLYFWFALASAQSLKFDYPFAKELTEQSKELLGSREGTIILINPHNGLVLSIVNEDIAISGEYRAGSIFKVVTATAALEENLIQEDTLVRCKGQEEFYGKIYSCWYRPGHKQVNIVKGLSLSCNIYFYHLGEKLGFVHLRKYAAKFNLGRKTGVDLPGEASGSLPLWLSGPKVLDMAIGQSKEMEVTPIQIAVMISSLANGGYLYKPRILHSTFSYENFQPEILGKVEFNKALPLLQQGLYESALYGTSTAANVGLKRVAGKTGTASRRDNPYQLDGWFAGYFPADSPEIGIVVFVRPGQGASDAAPLANRVLKAYQALRNQNLEK